MKTKINAKIIADSLNEKGCRLTTFVVEFPRIVLAELNTHRSLSKNSSSSRAIPFKTMLDRVKTDPFIPTKFQKDHKGMQGTEYLEGDEEKQCIEDWLKARDSAIESATSFSCPVTKQLRNRLLEPFLWHKVIISGTDFQNFFALRAHGDAEIHIQELAYKMLDVYNKNRPAELKEGEWHIPFGDKFDDERLIQLAPAFPPKGLDLDEFLNDLKVKIAVSRCARVSYNNFEGKDDYVADLKLFHKLCGSVPKHLSPLEHCAQTLNSKERVGNFQGFKQYRKFFDDENLKDDRVVLWKTL